MVLPTGTAVLNADDPTVLEMAPKCKGQILLCAKDHAAPELVVHRAEGGRTVAMRGGRIVFSVGDTPVHEAKWEHAQALFNQENQLAALGAAWALGLNPAQAVERLGRVVASPRAQRLRWVDHDGRMLALSTCRNLSALEAVLGAVTSKAPSHRVAICSQIASDCRVEDAQAQGRLLGAAFDRVEIVVSSNGVGLSLPQNQAADAPPAEHVAALRLAFADGVSAANRATFVESGGPLSARMRSVLGGLSHEDLLFVQVGNLKSMMALANGEEDTRTQSGTSTVTDAANLTRPLAET